MRPPQRSSIAFSALFAFAAAVATIGPAIAGGDNIATRCGWQGCNVIRCNDTGDRCYRLDGRYGGGSHYGYRTSRYDRYNGYQRNDRGAHRRHDRCGHRHDSRYESNGYGSGRYGNGGCGCDEHRSRYGRGEHDIDRYSDDYWQRRGYGEGYEQRQ